MRVLEDDLVSLRGGDAVYVVKPFPAADQFCVPVVKLGDADTGADRFLVLAEDVHPVGQDQ
jgi:hypothetical protein